MSTAGRAVDGSLIGIYQCAICIREIAGAARNITELAPKAHGVKASAERATAALCTCHKPAMV